MCKLLEQYPRPKIEEVQLSDFPSFDYVGLKYDGIWVYVVVEPHIIRLYSRTGKLKAEWRWKSTFSAIFIGEYLFGTNWAVESGSEGNIYIFDCVEFKELSIATRPFEVRGQATSRLIQSLPKNFKLAFLREASQAPALWEQYVLGELNYEGLVFYKKDQPYMKTYSKVKRTLTQDYILIDIIEGEGRLAGSTGALVAGAFLPNGKIKAVCRVGGGLSDEQRSDIWNNKSNYIGKVFEVKAYRIFSKTSSLRHPSFVRWRPDKAKSECVLSDYEQETQHQNTPAG